MVVWRFVRVLVVETALAIVIVSACSSEEGGGDLDACAPPSSWRYSKPGCGAAASPTCGPPGQDACAITLCSCEGKTILGCQWALEPWESYGPCDGGSDSGTD